MSDMVALRPLGEAIVRMPLLPVEAALDLLSKRGSALDRLAAMPEVRRALAISSLTLVDALERPSPSDLRQDRARSALLRYVMRMATRPTPFGTSAAVALVHFGEVTDLERDGAAVFTSTRLDLEWLAGLVQAAEERPEVRRRLRLRTHPAAWRRGGRVLLAGRAPRLGASSEQVSLRATGVVVRALEEANRPVLYTDLAGRLLATTPGASAEQVTALIDELWRSTLLISDLWPPLTCDDPALHVLDCLERIAEAQDVAQSLREVHSAAAALDSSSIDGIVDRHRQVVQLAGALSAHAADRPTMTDSRIPLLGDRINAIVGLEAARAASLLLSMSPLPTGPSWLAPWRRAFAWRYGVDRTVAVVEALDQSTGVGPPREGQVAMSLPPLVAARREAALVHIAASALAQGRVEVDLDETMLGELRTWSSSSVSPPSVDVNVVLAASSAAAIDAGDFDIVLGPNTGARRAGRGLGRFASLLGADGRRLLERCAAVVPDGRLPIELVYLPSGVRAANVAVRPAVVSREICLGVAPGVPDEAVVPLDQLRVGLSDGRLTLRWNALDMEVQVTSLHMLNSLRAPAICRFLAEVGEDGVAQLAPFNWGSAARFPRLPRVRCGRVVLRPAQWRIAPQVTSAELAGAEAGRFAGALASWRAAWLVPQHVYLVSADNRLLVDLENGEHVEILRREAARALRAGRHLQLEEVFPWLDRAWVQSPEGSYVTELTVPLVDDVPVTADRGRPTRAGAGAGGPDLPSPNGRHAAVLPSLSVGSHRHSPGSAWLFARLLLPHDAVDDAVAGPIGRFAESMVTAGHARSWFFVRYADPDPHVRLRFTGDAEKLISRVLPALAEAIDILIQGGVCSGWSIEPYDREVERYGGDEAIALAEDVFAADSRACAQILAALRAHHTSLDRTTLAVLSIDDLLGSLGLDTAQRLEWCSAMVTSRRAASAAFRRSNRELRRLLSDPAVSLAIAGEAVSSAFATRSAALLPVGRRLAELAAEGRLLRPLPDIHRALVHMHCNRLLGVDRAAEGMALGLLLRTHESLSRAPIPKVGGTS